MKKSIFTFLLILSGLTLLAQDQEGAAIKVSLGIQQHDQGAYRSAIKFYDEALDLDKDNFSALAEKALTLTALRKFEESIELCEKAISIYPDHSDLYSVYVTYGNALDGLGKSEASISVYDSGIAKFPKEHQLYFNKGISLTTVGKYTEAIEEFKNSLRISPSHPGTHNALGRVSVAQKKKTPAILALSTFLIFESNTIRAKQNLESLQKLLNSGLEKTGKNSYTLNFDAGMFGDTTAAGSPKPDSFTSLELILTLTSALSSDKKQTDQEFLYSKFNTIVSSLKERGENSGFFWDFYAPFFVEMKKEGYLETFTYLILTSSDDKKVNKWITKHPKDVDRFYRWAKSFNWKG